MNTTTKPKNVLTFNSYLSAHRVCKAMGLPASRIGQLSMQLYEIRLGAQTPRPTRIAGFVSTL